MGYTTTFTGHVTVEPPLNGPEMAFLRRFSRQEHAGPFDGKVCSWGPTDDGCGIQWTGREKFYNSTEWMQHLIDTFLKEEATEQENPSEEFRHFTFNHVVNGRIEAQGEDTDDKWTLVVKDNVVTAVKYPTLAERMNTDAKLQAAFETLRDAGVTVKQYAACAGEDY